MSTIDLIENLNELELKILSIRKDVFRNIQSEAMEEEFVELSEKIAKTRSALITKNE